MLAKELEQAQHELWMTEEKLENFVSNLLGWGEDWDTYCDSISFDPSDWDGYSLEIYGGKEKLEVSDEQVAAVKEQGFDVVCVHYADGTKDRFMSKERREWCTEHHGGKK